MTWLSPVHRRLVPTDDSMSFNDFGPSATGLPLFPHKGAFAVPRKYHVHEGVDLYVPEYTPVTAVEDGVCVDVQPFTGAVAGSPWWNDTWAVLVEGHTGVVVYGEVVPIGYTAEDPGQLLRHTSVKAGSVVGFVTPVLKTNKGRPTSMLHLELHTHGTREVPAWDRGGDPPRTLRDPTPHLMERSRLQRNCDYCDASVSFWRTPGNPNGCGSCGGTGWTDANLPPGRTLR